MPGATRPKPNRSTTPATRRPRPPPGPTGGRERRPRTGRQRRATRQTPRPEPPASSARATPTRASASPDERRFEFRGSAWRLLLWQLLGTITFAGTLLALLAGLPGCGWRPAERAMALVFLRLPPLKALALHVQSSLSSPPPWALVLGAGLLLVVACVASNAVRLYRTNHTYVYGMRLTCQEGWGLGEDAIALALTLLTAGLALPWVVARRRRWFYRSCHVRGTNLALEFRGTGLQALGLILLTALALPLVVLSLGVLALRVQLWWIAWERGRLWIPDADGRLHPARFEASGPDYVKHMAPRQLATLLSLGLYRPWALVAAWRWLDRRTHID